MVSKDDLVPARGLGGGIAHLYATLWRFAAGSRRWFVLALLLLFGAQLLRLTIPYFFGQAVNALQTSAAQDIAGAALHMGLMLAAAVLAWVLHGPGRVLERFTAVRVRERFADALYARAMARGLRWHEAHHSGDTIQRVSKATSALFGFAQHQFIYLQNAVNLIGPIVALAIVSAVTGGAALAGYVLIAAILLRFDRVFVRLIRKENEAERRYLAELVDSLGNVATVLTLRLQAATRRLVAARLEAVGVPLRRSIIVNEAKWCAVDLLNNALRVGLVVLYGWMAWREGGVILVGTAVMVHQYAQQLGGVVGAMATHWQDLVRQQADLAGADELLAASPPAEDRTALPADWREIHIRDLRFAHAAPRGDRPALDGLSLVLRRGGRVALVGGSGAGKSTLMRVLAGLYEAERISIHIDGRDRDDLRDLSGVATLVPQDPELFETTVRRNVTLGVDHPAEAVDAACALSGFDEVVDGLPSGLDTDIAERGLNLSGGQKQRLALARGILAAQGRSLVMLDEPTSSTDPITEARIYDNLLAAFPDACIVSSIHRLHLLTRFDTVVLMDEGRILDVGTMDELLARQPRFQAMWRGYNGLSVAASEAIRAA